jgi:hypothetical protein
MHEEDRGTSSTRGRVEPSPIGVLAGVSLLAAGLRGFDAFGVSLAGLGLEDRGPSGASSSVFRLRNLTASRAPLAGLRIEGLGALGLPASLLESFTRTSGSMSLGILHNSWVSTGQS